MLDIFNTSVHNTLYLKLNLSSEDKNKTQQYTRALQVY